MPRRVAFDDGDTALEVRPRRQGYRQPALRQQRPEPVRPFDQDDAGGERFFDAQLERLLGIIDPVQVEMPDRRIGDARLVAGAS